MAKRKAATLADVRKAARAYVHGAVVDAPRGSAVVRVYVDKSCRLVVVETWGESREGALSMALAALRAAREVSDD